MRKFKLKHLFALGLMSISFASCFSDSLAADCRMQIDKNGKITEDLTDSHIFIENCLNDEIYNQLEKIYDTSDSRKINLLSLVDVSNEDIAEIANLKPFAKGLLIQGNQITDIKPVKNFIKDITGVGILAENLEDASSLAKFKDLTSIRLVTPKLKSIKWMEGLTKLNSISISADSLTSLDGIPAAPAEKISLINIKMNDLTPLTSMTNLHEILFRDAKLGDLSSICKLKNIQKLGFAGTEISDFGTLKDCSKLTDVSFHKISGLDLTGLGKVTSITDIDIFKSEVKSLDFLKDLKQLSSLKMSLTNKPDLSPIAQSSIKDLSIWHMVTDFAQLKNAKLKKLSYSAGTEKVVNTDAISTMHDLDSLELIGLVGANSIDGNFAKTLHNLKELSISSSDIVSYKGPMKDLTQLETLTLDRVNRETEIDLSFISSLKSLKTIQFHRINVKNFDAIAACKTLERISLNHVSGLSSLDVLKSLPNLQTVEISRKLFTEELLKALPEKVKIELR